ncbi:MAG: hypothetical protein M3281_07225, partial [Chloroflexota bacterium]|nr:hypothetical protein [Chloroflexota bacterium]
LQPPAPAAPPPFRHSLVPLALASLLILAALLRLVRGREWDLVMLAAMLLVSLVWLLERRGERQGGPDEPDELGPEGKEESVPGFELRRLRSLGAGLRSSILWLVLVLVLVRGYMGPVLHDWPYLRGQDQYAHTVMTNLVMTEGSGGSFLVYPPGLHILTAILSHLSALYPLDLYAAIAPALLVLPTLAAYALGNRLFGRDYALPAALFMGLVFTGPWMTLRDSMYADLIAAQYLLLLVVASLMMLLSRPAPRTATLFVLLGASVAFYHSITTIYLLLVLAPVGSLLLLYLLLKDRVRGLWLLSSLIAVGLLSLVYTWNTYHLSATVGRLLGLRQAGTATSGLASGLVGSQAPRPLQLLPSLMTPTIAWLGLLGLLMLLFGILRPSNRRAVASVVLVGWTLLMFTASRTSLNPVPVRFARDLGIPLTFCAAFAFVAALRSFDRSSLTSVLAVALVSLVVVVQVEQGLVRASNPVPQLFMTSDIAAAGRWLRDHNTGGNIMVSPHLDQVPANVMLALGRYSALRSSPRRQLGNPRDLPAWHRDEARDVLWVLAHPTDRRALRILRRRDVRYVVLYKRLPSYWRGKDPVNWQRFLQVPGTYERAFENGQVLIVKVIG